MASPEDAALAATPPPPPPPPRSSGLAAETLEERLNAILSSSNFTVASYLNAALAGGTGADGDGGDRLRRTAAELALQLQLRTSSCHEEIGRIGAELRAVLPRCAADAGRVAALQLPALRRDGEALLREAAAVRVGAEGGDASPSLETLSTLHALRANLRRTREILRAAATWDATLASAAPLLAEQNLSEAVAALAVLERGERALRGMPRPEDRRSAIARIRQRVSAQLAPQLRHALAGMNTRLAPLQQCVSLYSQLDRMDDLLAEYVRNRPAAIHRAWFEYQPGIPAAGTGGGGGGGAASGGEKKNEDAFSRWLPGWFDAVLQLVTEERRQALAIFGAELVPVVVIKVLYECFRPILPSFQSRLESICSSDPAGPSTGSLQSISTLYESMLQFLSLAYESIVGGWLDTVDSNVLQAKGPVWYQELLQDVFVKVASPFARYQRNLSQLETKYLATESQKLSRDIQNAVSTVFGGRRDLELLQSATDQLQRAATDVFPLAEGAVARFELMTGGCSATPALSAVDQLLANHAHGLSTALQRMSSSADDGLLADSFDEPHVLCALEMLKVAGTFFRCMRSLEDKTRERLSLLCERVASHVAREKKLRDALAGTSGGKKSSFPLPDSLTAVEIDSLLTKAVCVDETDGTDAVIAVLQRLAVSGDNPLRLYPDAERAMKKLTTACHAFVFDVCVAVPRLHLTGMSSMATWKETAGSDSLVASYGTLPQPYITGVGEHMLALVQALEPFASDKDALELANEVMVGVRGVAQQPWLDFCASVGSSELSENVVLTLMDGKGMVDLVMGNAVVEEEEGEEDEEEQDEDAKASAAFCNAWLDVVGLAVTGRLLERIMRIPSLTPKGCEHLNADLGYLVNVFSALGISGHPHPLLGHLAEIVVVEGDVAAERIANLDRTDPVSALLRSVEERLAAIRGIAAKFRY